MPSHNMIRLRRASKLLSESIGARGTPRAVGYRDLRHTMSSTRATKSIARCASPGSDAGTILKSDCSWDGRSSQRRADIVPECYNCDINISKADLFHGNAVPSEVSPVEEVHLVAQELQRWREVPREHHDGLRERDVQDPCSCESAPWFQVDPYERVSHDSRK